MTFLWATGLIVVVTVIRMWREPAGARPLWIKRGKQLSLLLGPEDVYIAG